VRHGNLQQPRIELFAAFEQACLGAAAFGVGHGDRIGAGELHDVKRRDDETVGAAADGVARAELHAGALLHLNVHETGRGWIDG
jgi:hypothetical protein